MTKDEVKKDCLIRATVNKQASVSDVARRLGLSERQVLRLKAKIKKGESLLHKNCGNQSRNLDDLLKQKIVDLYKSFEFSGANFLFFKQLLFEHHQIKISYNALKTLLNKADIRSPRKRKKKEKHSRRPPRECFGDMLQGDATPHQFFLPFGDVNHYSLHGFIDDATGTITSLYMTKNECADGYFEVLRDTLVNFGSPASIYIDGLSLFFSSKKDKLSKQDILNGVEEHKTQVGKILDDLGIELIRALSPQAKGKIERLWETLQSRLFIEFKIHKIDTVEKANKFLKTYIKRYNDQFAHPAFSEKSMFMQLPKSVNLDTLLTLRETRKLDAGLAFSLNKTIFSVPKCQPHATVEILFSSRLGMKVLYKDSLYDVVPLRDENKFAFSTQDSIRKKMAAVVQSYIHRNEKLCIA